MNPRKLQPPKDPDRPISYGDPNVGIWYCVCGYSCFPRRLFDKDELPPFKCPKCGGHLQYDEEE